MVAWCAFCVLRWTLRFHTPSRSVCAHDTMKVSLASGLRGDYKRQLATASGAWQQDAMPRRWLTFHLLCCASHGETGCLKSLSHKSPSSTFNWRRACLARADKSLKLPPLSARRQTRREAHPAINSNRSHRRPHARELASLCHKQAHNMWNLSDTAKMRARNKYNDFRSLPYC